MEEDEGSPSPASSARARAAGAPLLQQTLLCRRHGLPEAGGEGPMHVLWSKTQPWAEESWSDYDTREDKVV